MLPDRDLQLLTAYLDGEISPREHKQVTRLLETSPTAQTVLQLLTADARRVRELTRLKLGPDFPAKVARTLAQSGVRPRPAHHPSRAPAPWIGLTVAASIFVMIAVGSYWYFAPRPEAARMATASPAGKVTEGALGRFTERALHLTVADLAAESTRKTLMARLQRDSAYHVDLAIQDNSRAVRRLAATLKQSGVHVVIPAIVEELKRTKGTMTYCLFADNLKPEELARLLQQLGIPAAGRKDAGVGHVIVDAMTPEHQQKLVALCGTADRNAGPDGTEARDPLGELVNKRIIPGNSAGQGTSSIEPKVSPLPERFALVVPLPQGDLSGLGGFPEVREFMSKRRGQVPGAVQVFLVIHEAKS